MRFLQSTKIVTYYTLCSTEQSAAVAVPTHLKTCLFGNLETRGWRLSQKNLLYLSSVGTFEQLAEEKQKHSNFLILLKI